MTTLILKPVSPAERSQWIDAFHAADPTLTIIDWDDPSAPPETVDYAFAWQPEGRRIAAMPNLRAVISPAAGLDHILRDPAFPVTCRSIAWARRRPSIRWAITYAGQP